MVNGTMVYRQNYLPICNRGNSGSYSTEQSENIESYIANGPSKVFPYPLRQATPTMPCPRAATPSEQPSRMVATLWQERTSATTLKLASAEKRGFLRKAALFGSLLVYLLHILSRDAHELLHIGIA